MPNYTTNAIVALLSSGLGGIAQGYTQQKSLQDERAEKEKNSRNEVNLKLFDRLLTAHEKVAADPNASPDQRKKSTDTMDQIFEAIMGGKTGASGTFDYPEPVQAPPGEESNLPEGFKSWPPGAKEQYLREQGKIGADPMDAANLKYKEQQTATSAAQEKYYKSQAAKNYTTKDKDAPARDPKIQLQIDDKQAKMKRLLDEKEKIKRQYDSAEGEYIYASPQAKARVEEIDAQLKALSGQIDSLTTPAGKKKVIQGF